MEDEFNNKELIDFANSLRFQVRALIPNEIKNYDIDIRECVYKEALFIGKQLLKDNFKDTEFCKMLIQICAEWTFHICVDLFLLKIPQKYHKLFIRKINIKIYRFTINESKNKTDIFENFSDSKINKDIEKLVKKQYEFQLKALYRNKKISKEICNNALKNRYIEKMEKMMDDENSFNINVSLWEIIKPNLFMFLVYIAIIHVFTIYAIGHYMHKKYVACIIAIIVLCAVIWRICCISVDFKVTPPKD